MMTVRILQFVAIIVSAIALIPSGAHLAALPNKLALPQTEYFTVQGIYRGWASLGLLWPAAVVLSRSCVCRTIAEMAVLVRRSRSALLRRDACHLLCLDPAGQFRNAELDDGARQLGSAPAPMGKFPCGEHRHFDSSILP